MENTTHNWHFTSVGGATRIKITSGGDIVNLDKLDRKIWTVLSCPTQGLEFDSKTLDILDSNKDGKIRVDEVLAAAKWLTTVIKDPELLMKGESAIALSAFNEGTEEGARLLGSARHILASLGLERDSISLEDTADNVRIFKGTSFNGDGVITVHSAGEDEALAKVIGQIMETIGKRTDRCGDEGVDAEQVEAFYKACADYNAWQNEGRAEDRVIHPYGADTEAALAACNEMKEKIDDYFMRCKLINFDTDVAGALDLSVEKIGNAGAGLLTVATDEVASAPLFRPTAEAVLPLDAPVNPAWSGKFNALKTLVFDVDFPGAKQITEADWNGVPAKFAAYTGWKGKKAGAEVEALGAEEVAAILKADRKSALLDLIARDKDKEEEALSIESVDNLLHLYRDFVKFLNNYLVFDDFYSNGNSISSIFQAGRLYIDQRACDLCIRVTDMGKHADMTSLSGMYILYCSCTSKEKNAAMDIAAVLTAGDVNSLRVGKNGVFYDREGQGWDATVTRIVENPISIGQAFWSPYRKFGRWISEKMDKSASEMDSNALNKLTNTAESASLAATDGSADKKAAASQFDIAKFAGIFAAIGMAIGYLASAVASLIHMSLLKLLIAVVAIVLIISLPSMFMAWRKLRKRNLGPLLNANGWAINSICLVGIRFGSTLTALVKDPRMQIGSPEEKRRLKRRKFFRWLLVIVILAAAVYGGREIYSRISASKKAKAAEAQTEQVVEEAFAEPVEVIEAEDAGSRTDEVSEDGTGAEALELAGD